MTDRERRLRKIKSLTLRVLRSDSRNPNLSEAVRQHCAEQLKIVRTLPAK